MNEREKMEYTGGPRHAVQPVKRFVAHCYEWLEALISSLIVVVLLFTLLFRIVNVSGPSMLPTLQSNDRVLLTSYFYQPKQGDVVVITHTAKLQEPIIKRVIATEGQTVDFDYNAGTVLVDGQVVDETQFGLENGITGEPFSSFQLLEFPQTVPEGCVFVLGDNRAVSEDSRYQDVGMIDKRNILGKAVLHLFPFQDFGLV